jgi:3-isopropylmalate/(R)-2-methylmalate dehydratase small subunit
MKPVSVVRGTMAPLFLPNIDTDQIVPKQFLKRVERSGFGEFLFYNWAHKPDGSPDPDFVLNKPEYSNAKILVAGPNFGSGSSREHAVWAIQDRGFQAVVAPSFADIFYGNASKVGLLCASVDYEVAERLVEMAETDPAIEAEIDLRSQSVRAGGLSAGFKIDPHIRERLLNGWDDIALTQLEEEKIAIFEGSRPEFLPRITRPVSLVANPLELVPRRRTLTRRPASS